MASAGRERGLAGKTSRLFLKSNVDVRRVSGCQDTRPLAVVTSRPGAIAGRGGMVAARGGFVFLGQHRDIGFDGGSGVSLASRRLGDTRYLYGSEESLCQQLVSLFERDAGKS